MNVKGVAFHATALQQVANDLQKSINQARKPTVGRELDFAKWFTGYVSSTLILRAPGDRTDAQGPILHEDRKLSAGA